MNTPTTISPNVLTPQSFQPIDVSELQRLRLAELYTSTPKDVLQKFAEHSGVKEKSRGTYVRAVRQFLDWLGKTGRPLLGRTDEGLIAPALTTADLNNYIDALEAGGKQPTTIQCYVIAVRRFLAFLEEFGLHFAIGKLNVPKTEKEFSKKHLTEGQVEKLLSKIQRSGNLRDYAIINLMLRTGLRTIEVVRLDEADITLDGGRRILRIQGKGHSKKDKFVILTDKAFRPIRRYIDSRPATSEVFEMNDGKKKVRRPLFQSNANRDKGQRMTTRSISRIAKNALVSIGINDDAFTAHSLRHTTAVCLRHAGASWEEIQQVLRHSSIDTTKIYLNSDLTAQRLAENTEGKLDILF